MGYQLSPFSDKHLNEGERLRGRWLHNIRRHLLIRLQRIQVPRVRDNLLPAGGIFDQVIFQQILSQH